MQDEPRYDDVVSEVAAFLEERLAFAVAAGIPEERICLDPGIGFGKTTRHNIELLLGLAHDRRARPARSSSASPASGSSPGSPATTSASSARSRRPSRSRCSPTSAAPAIIRAHDVREHVEALEAAHAFEVANGWK